MRWAWLAGFVLALGCGGGRTVEVVLVGDLRPVLDFADARAELLEDVPESRLTRYAADAFTPDPSADLREGIVVATIDGVEPGDYRAAVALTDLSGAFVGRGVTRFTVRDDDARVRVRVTRACLGVSCPDQTRPQDEGCVAGACVDSRCSPGSRAYCPAPQCMEDTDCPPPADGPPCLVPVCLSGECGLYPDDSRCVAGSCDPVGGCGVAEMDAGMSDAGAPDAGMIDAGCTSTPETCNSIDDDCNGLVDDGADVCPCPIVENRGRTYAICDQPRSWDDARSFCQVAGYDLAVLETTQEHVELLDLARTRFDEIYWIGLHDMETEGTFVWVDGTPLGEDSWGPMQPDDFDTGEDCTAVRPVGDWNDSMCATTYRFVCEVP